MLYAVNDDNTDQDAGRVETPTAMEDSYMQACHTGAAEQYNYQPC